MLGCSWLCSPVTAQAKCIPSELPLGKWCYMLAFSENCPDLEVFVASDTNIPPLATGSHSCRAFSAMCPEWSAEDFTGTEVAPSVAVWLP